MLRPGGIKVVVGFSLFIFRTGKWSYLKCSVSGLIVNKKNDSIRVTRYEHCTHHMKDSFALLREKCFVVLWTYKHGEKYEWHMAASVFIILLRIPSNLKVF